MALSPEKSKKSLENTRSMRMIPVLLRCKLLF